MVWLHDGKHPIRTSISEHLQSVIQSPTASLILTGTKNGCNETWSLTTTDPGVIMDQHQG
jgi:hypothetical protein